MSAHASMPSEFIGETVAETIRVALPHRAGATLSVQSFGAGGLPCVFIHGFGEGGYVWRDIVANSGLRQRQITLDLLGHGESSWSEDGRYDSGSHVADLFAMADALRLGRFVVVGHSWGGNIAARMAIAQPERVVGLVMCDTEAESAPEATAHLLASFKASHRTYRSVDDYAQEMMALRPLPTRERLQAIAACALRLRDDGLFEPKVDPRLGDAYTRAKDTGHCWDLLGAVACPSMVVRGAISGVLGNTQAQRMTKMMRAAVLATVPAAGHALMTDNPAGFLEVVRPFLTRFQLSGASPAPMAPA